MEGQPPETIWDRPMLVFTDEGGSVVLIEPELARVLGFDDPDDALGDPLASVLGTAADLTRGLLSQIASQGQVQFRLIQARDRRTGHPLPVLFSGWARSAEGKFIGADIALAPPSFSIPADYFSHRDKLEQMAAMVREHVRAGAGPSISGKKEIELRTYVAACMLALYVLIVRMTGRALGATFEGKVRHLTQERGWPISFHNGRLSFAEGALAPEAYRAIMETAVAYAVKVTTKRLVSKELSEIDLNFDEATLHRAAQFGLRTES
jgi:hypothetical protein